jgi:predicted adenine nucleotide alpha hydrolase (AANH) superfamily ATPase
MEKDLTLFEGHEIRRHFDEKTETWLFSVVDIIRVLTQQTDYQAARKYWKVLKGRLKKEGSQSVTDCYQLKLTALAAANHRIACLLSRLVMFSSAGPAGVAYDGSHWTSTIGGTNHPSTC